MSILVTGGAGYIGSHAVRHLTHAGYDVVVIDNLSRGHRAAVALRVPFHLADIADKDRVVDILEEHRVECVMHFAAFANVGESVEKPLLYYANNTAGTLRLLEAMRTAGVKKMIFSSTCATVGSPESLPILETSPQQPINPYGWSKLFVERMLIDWAAADPGFSFAALRYFNVAGCASDGSLGEDHDPETHLIPILLQVALDHRGHATVFGDDYPTPDGTCLRDYIHVEDLCEAHRVAMQALRPGDARFYNLGIGRGHSVREVIESVRRVTGHSIPVLAGPRRAGDPAVLYANADKIRRELGWTAQVTELDGIVDSAWRWFRAHPRGYEDRL